MPYIDRDNLMKDLSTMYKTPTSNEDLMTIGYDHAIADVVVTVHEYTLSDVVERKQDLSQLRITDGGGRMKIVIDIPKAIYDQICKEKLDGIMARAIRFGRPLPSPQPEPLTDKEQRIFLAAMGREEKVCKETDAEMTREPYEDSLVRVCREIERKVKGALWT